MTILAFDLGTTNFKAALFDERLATLALARRPTPRTPNPPGVDEIEPEAMRSTIADLVDDLRRQSPDSLAVVGRVSYSTQANSFTLVDALDRPLLPLILWTDGRASSLRDRIDALADGHFRAQTGLPALDYQFAPAKLLWLQDNAPRELIDAKRFCTISDLLTLWLTGRHVTDAGSCGLTGLIDIHSLTWREPLVSTVGLRRPLLPEIVRSGAPIGTLSGDLARALGLPRDAIAVAGTLDQYAGAIGAGAVSARDVCETTGTALTAVRLSEGFNRERPADGFWQGPSHDPRLFFRMAVGRFGGNLLETYLRGHPELTIEALDRLVDSATTSCEIDIDRFLRLGEIRFEPLSCGEPGAQITAIFRAVAIEGRSLISRICGGAMPAEVCLAGGAARSAAWERIKRETYGCRVIPPFDPEPALRGAAWLTMPHRPTRTGPC